MQNKELNYEFYMRKAIELSKIARKKDDVPVGAVIVKDNKIIASAYNKKERKGDCTQHAEIIAIKKACRKLKDFRLSGCIMFVSLEPCVMCMGAILSSRLDTLVFAASQDKQNILSAKEINERSGLNHKCKIVEGVLKTEASEIISDYFRTKRKK